MCEVGSEYTCVCVCGGGGMSVAYRVASGVGFVSVMLASKTSLRISFPMTSAICT